MLRDATIGDLDALMELEAACFPPDQAFSREAYRHALRAAQAVDLVRVEAGAIVGFVGAFHHRRWRVGHVYTLNVHPKERRRGIGRALLEACEARLAALGMRRVALEVHVGNRAGVALYEACGYERVGRIQGYYEGLDDNDAWRYEKLL